MCLYNSSTIQPPPPPPAPPIIDYLACDWKLLWQSETCMYESTGVRGTKCISCELTNNLPAKLRCFTFLCLFSLSSGDTTKQNQQENHRANSGGDCDRRNWGILWNICHCWVVDCSKLSDFIISERKCTRTYEKINRTKKLGTFVKKRITFSIVSARRAPN